MFVNFSDQDHGDDLHGLGIGDAEAFAEHGLDVETLEPEVDLWATAVDENGTEADAGEEDEVVDDGGLEGLGFHGCASILDYDGLASEFLDEGKRFGENVNSELTRSGRVRVNGSLLG